MDRKKEHFNNITIGADPEFVLLSNYGTVQNANNHKMFTSGQAEIGCDGCGTPVEIRPPPALLTNIDKFTSDIHDIFGTIARYCHKEELKILGGCEYEGSAPIGGHIHFGGNDFLEYKNRESYKNVDKLRWLLDMYFIPIINSFIPPEKIQRRIDIGYGRLGQVRDQPHGFEYRTPYSFLISPLLTKASFALAALIGHNYKKLKFHIKTHQMIAEHYYDIKNTPNLFSRIYKTIKPTILRMMKYNSPNPKLNPHILSLFSLVEQKRRCKSLSILDNYSLLPPPPQKFKIFFSHGSQMGRLKYMLKNHIRNRNKGIIYIYGVDTQRSVPDTRTATIFLSENLPKITTPRHVHISHYPALEFKGISHKIGISWELRQAIENQRISSSFLINYINNLKLKRV